MNHRGRWRIGALAGAIAVLGSLASLEAHALALGRITVQSALGEPLRGEVEITDMSAEEASSLKVGVASAEAFRAAGLDYPSALAGLDIKLQRRSNGRPYLRLNSSRAVTEPFVDLILEANSSSGRITRDYTMLFDPPNLRAGNTELAPTAPILPRPDPVAAAQPDTAMAPASPETPDPLASFPLADAAKPAPEMTPARPASGEQLAPEMTPARPASGEQLAPEMTPAQPAYATQPAPEMASARQTPVARATAPPITTAQEPPAPRNSRVVVKAGDTATRIATRNKSADVSLDQMLVAMLRGNPDAFIGGNINMMKSGAVLDIPPAEEAGALPPAEASQVIVAQSKDFNAFRRKLAQRVATAQVATANRQVEGNLQAQVEDRAQTSAPPGKLTLSKGVIQGKAAAETIAKEKQAKDTSTRMAELSKNISELNKIAAAPTAPVPTSTPASAPATVPGLAIPVATPASLTPPQPPASAASASAAAASAADAASAATATASDASSAEASLAAASEPALAASAEAAPEPAAIKKPVVTAPPPEPEPEPELIDQVMDNALPIGAGLLALLGALGLLRYRQQQKKRTAPVDSSFLESRLQPDSFFGASGGSRVNTNNDDGENSITGSSMAYTPSQMDASGDVDPVAEADVYLAYGRDEQAEDILKEALQTYPTHVAIHAKLLEIYAKRRDIKAFEKLAAEAFKLTQGQGAEWALIIARGAELDPNNTLYRASEAAPEKHPPPAASASAPPGAVAAAILPAAPATSAASAGMDMDIGMDMGMDFSLDDAPQVSAAPAPVPSPAPPPVPTPARPAPSPASATPPAATFADLDLGLDFDIEPTAAPAPPKPPAPPPVAARAAVQAPPPEIDLLSNSLDFTPMPVAAPKPVAALTLAKAAPAHDGGMMEFDLDAFSLDFAPPTQAPASVQSESQEEDPLEVKFMLAEEFRSLGDTDGARSLADEVLAKAKGPLKIKAQAFLNALS